MPFLHRLWVKVELEMLCESPTVFLSFILLLGA